jgi:hypothetical protein
MMMQREHVVGNVLDEVADLKRRLERLEAMAVIGQLGPYTASAPAATGYLVAVVYVNGMAITYKLLAAT